MPLLFFSILGLAIFGALQLPSWLKSLVFTFVGFLVLCAVGGFIWSLLKQSLLPVFRKNGQLDKEGLQLRQDSGASPSEARNTTPPPPARPDQQSIRRDAEEAALFEDEFLQ